LGGIIKFWADKRRVIACGDIVFALDDRRILLYRSADGRSADDVSNGRLVLRVFITPIYTIWTL
jgi:hypothetical protein